MHSLVLFGGRMVHRDVSRTLFVSRRFCDGADKDSGGNGFHNIEDPLRSFWSPGGDDVLEDDDNGKCFNGRRGFVRRTKVDAAKVLGVLRQHGPGFDATAALDGMHIRVSGLLVRKVLLGILRTINDENKARCAKLGSSFFWWSKQQNNYTHTTNSYHLVMKILAECEEFVAMGKLADEMIDSGLRITAQTFNILICSCWRAGSNMKKIEKLIKSKNFNYLPFKHSYNAILHSLLSVREYELIEMVYEQMLADHQLPDILTYNIRMCAKLRLGNSNEFKRLFDEMYRHGLHPDFHTYNILLHHLGKENKPLDALCCMNHMKEVGMDPTILHFTTLMDGLSRAGNLDACEHFFDAMIKNGWVPDVVCYTVMITGYAVAGNLEKAQKMFDDMTAAGQLPNVFTYNAMIRGLCGAGKFEEACSMLKEMQSRGCKPNFLVYSTLVRNLQNAGKLSEAHQIIKEMEKGRYSHLASKAKRYKKC